MSEDAELEVYDAVDEIPEDQKPVKTRGSKWDGVIQQAIAIAGSDRPWLPVARPKAFAGAQVKWLRKRNPGILVELGTDRVFLKWDPARAAELRAQEEQIERVNQEGAGGE